MRETKIYVGLNDSGIQAQKYDDSVYVSILKKVCCSYKVPFSFNMSEGGYLNEKGEFMQQHMLVISLVDMEDSIAEEIAKDLCAFFHQPSVLMTVSEVKSKYIKERI